MILKVITVKIPRKIGSWRNLRYRFLCLHRLPWYNQCRGWRGTATTHAESHQSYFGGIIIIFAIKTLLLLLLSLLVLLSFLPPRSACPLFTTRYYPATETPSTTVTCNPLQLVSEGLVMCCLDQSKSRSFSNYLHAPSPSPKRMVRRTVSELRLPAFLSSFKNSGYSNKSPSSCPNLVWAVIFLNLAASRDNVLSCVIFKVEQTAAESSACGELSHVNVSWSTSNNWLEHGHELFWKYSHQ